MKESETHRRKKVRRKERVYRTRKKGRKERERKCNKNLDSAYI
jgi:hypothetical protein